MIINSKEDLREIAIAFQKSRVLLTSYELGIWSAVGKSGKTSAEAARIIKADKRATDRLMNALCAIGLLIKRKNKFFNSSFSGRFFIKGKPSFLTGMGHTVHTWETWSTLTKAVKHGTSVMEEETPGYKSWPHAFIAAMHERAFKNASRVISMIDLSKVSRVLDIGGGSGAYSMAFVKASKNIKATVFDLPEVIPITKSYIKKEGLLDKINFVSGDYTKDSFGSNFDLTFLSAIIHINSLKENQKLINKCVKALNYGGQVVVQDFIMDENRVSPTHGALFALNMLVATESGDTYTESEVKTLMRKAGLTNIIRKDNNFGSILIMGRKIRK